MRILSSLALLSLTTALATADTKAPAKPDTIAAADRALAFDLAKKIAPNNNAVFSPASVHTALAMTYAGARGATADEMRKALHLDAGADVHDRFNALATALAKLEHKDQSFHMVNRLFGMKDYPWSPAFLALTKSSYGAPLEPVDFGQPEPTRLHINSWVSDQTNKKIVDLLPKDSLTTDTRLVLTNAVYFKGAWQHPFVPAATIERPFAIRGGATAKVATMQTNDQFKLGGDADTQILEMPYSHGDIAMDILLPRTKDGLAAVEKKLDGDGFTKLVGTLKSQQVDVALPKWKVRTAVEMKGLFQQLGMQRAFDSRADFTGMVEKTAASRVGRLYIDQIYHQGFVAVDEAGTEAAAATAVVMNDESARAVPESVSFRADHPFAWVIRDLSTGEILFYGRVVDPRG